MSNVSVNGKKMWGKLDIYSELGKLVKSVIYCKERREIPC